MGPGVSYCMQCKFYKLHYLCVDECPPNTRADVNRRICIDTNDNPQRTMIQYIYNTRVNRNSGSKWPNDENFTEQLTSLYASLYHPVVNRLLCKQWIFLWNNVWTVIRFIKKNHSTSRGLMVCCWKKFGHRFFQRTITVVHLKWI